MFLHRTPRSGWSLKKGEENENNRFLANGDGLDIECDGGHVG
jgi:hypothetical protein